MRILLQGYRRIIIRLRCGSLSKVTKCHDPNSPVYELVDEYDPTKALPKTFFMLLDNYQSHPESKSVGPDGRSCDSKTRGLLQRANVTANWPPIYIGKESDRHLEKGDDLSFLDFKAVQYRRKGNAIADDNQLTDIVKIAKREFMRRGVSQHTLEKICNRKSVRAVKPPRCLKVVEALKKGAA